MSLKDHPLFQKFLSLELPVENYAIIGSAPMYAHGLKKELHDIDVLARGKAWELAKKYHQNSQSYYGDNEVSVYLGDIEIFDRWEPGDWDTDKIIDGADIIEGLPFAKLIYVAQYKKMMSRDKDKRDLKALEDYFNKLEKEDDKHKLQ